MNLGLLLLHHIKLLKIQELFSLLYLKENLIKLGEHLVQNLHLFLIGELVAALRANDSDAFRDLLAEGIEELGVKEVEELLLDWLYSFLTVEEQDRLLGRHLGVSF